jgi:type II secretory pathway pseudopilin PulG
MKRSSGFTLIELMVVCAVMIIMTAIAVPTGISVLESYRFSAMSRSFATAILMARMRAVENKSVYRINASTPGASTGRIRFTTLLNIPLRFRPNSLAVTPGDGDRVMFSGLDKNAGINGVELEVQVCDRTMSPPTFEVDYDVFSGADTTGTVRNITAPARLIILPAQQTINPNWGIDPLTGIYRNEEHFGSSGYSIREDGSDVIFAFDWSKYRFFFRNTQWDPNAIPPDNNIGDELLATGSDPTSGGAPPYSFQQVIMDSRGLPERLSGRTITMCQLRQHYRPDAVFLNSFGTIVYVITPTGRVTTATTLK